MDGLVAAVDRLKVEWNILFMLIVRKMGVMWALDRLEALLTRLSR